MALIEHARIHLEAGKFLELSDAIVPFSLNRFVTWHDVHDPTQLSLIFGHYVHEEMLKYFGNASFLFTVLRNPIERHESQYFFDRRISLRQNTKVLELDRFLEYKRNGMCKFLAQRFPSIAAACGHDTVAAAVKCLGMFDRVYLYENFAGQIAEVCQMLSMSPQLPPTNQRDPGMALSDAEKEKIRLACQDDLQVYETVRSIFGTSGAKRKRAVHSDLVAERTQLLGNAFSDAKLNEFLAGYTYSEFRNWKRLEEYQRIRERQLQAIRQELDVFERRSRRL
jgi:hypothetical protein